MAGAATGPARGPGRRDAGGGGGSLPAVPLARQTPGPASFKEKESNPLTELRSGSGARTAPGPPPAAAAFFSASASSPAQRAAAGGGGNTGGGGAPRPLRRGAGEGGEHASPAPKADSTNRLNRPLRGVSRMPNRNLRSGRASVVGTWRRRGKHSSCLCPPAPLSRQGGASPIGPRAEGQTPPPPGPAPFPCSTATFEGAGRRAGPGPLGLQWVERGDKGGVSGEGRPCRDLEKDWRS